MVEQETKQCQNNVMKSSIRSNSAYFKNTILECLHRYLSIYFTFQIIQDRSIILLERGSSNKKRNVSVNLPVIHNLKITVNESDRFPGPASVYSQLRGCGQMLYSPPVLTTRYASTRVYAYRLYICIDQVPVLVKCTRD